MCSLSEQNGHGARRGQHEQVVGVGVAGGAAGGQAAAGRAGPRAQAGWTGDAHWTPSAPSALLHALSESTRRPWPVAIIELLQLFVTSNRD